MKLLTHKEDLSFLLASSLSLKILFAIYQLPVPTPTLIAKFVQTSPSNVSTKLIFLKRRGLTVCLTPERRKGRIYTLTKKGKYIIDLLNSRVKRLILNAEIKYVKAKGKGIQS
ncbi:MAG: hypothetical protein QXD89_01785 [Candidatus Aenigmatarchaeota archaeon]